MTDIASRRAPPGEVTLGTFRARPGERVQARLEVPGLDPQYHPYVSLVAGAEPGPVVSVVAGIHGAEVSSIEAARRLCTQLAGKLLCGTVMIVPVANLAGFFARSLYVNPLDELNLNRTFPGRPDGSATERLAHALVRAVVEPADVVFDLHGGDIVEALDPFMLAEQLPGRSVDARSLRMADRFGLDQVVASHVGGSLVAVATEMGKASLLAECGQQGVVSELAARRLAHGVENVLGELGMLPAPAPAPGHPVFRPSWTWMTSQHTGFWIPDAAVVVGRELAEGARIGQVHSLGLDEPPVDIVSPHAGRVIFLVTALSTVPGTPLCAVAKAPAPWPLDP